MSFSFTNFERERFLIITKKVKGRSQVIHYVELGNLEVVEWLIEIGHHWNEWTITYAAEKGHLEVVKWLRENGCPWDEQLIAYAAGGGHLEVVK